ncbi:YceD family protein [Marimonas lutisalis]|uniref:YceD family protein n=1 Tax=Marimonas lutisalis TaxID=2545756 RepID=UPI0010F7B0D5|nr:DUF177 domain-containing protein [Marimonas lutisalis]
MTRSAPATRFRVSDLSQTSETTFALRPDADALAAIAAELGLDGLRKLSFTGTITADGRRDWRLDAHLGATVVQPCVVTLAPVTTRIEEDVHRRYLAHLPEDDAGEEVEMPEDETINRLGDEIDVTEAMIEALALALPLYPRADGAELGEAVYTEPGKAPMRDEDARPFAGLASLRDKLEKDE